MLMLPGQLYFSAIDWHPALRRYVDPHGYTPTWHVTVHVLNRLLKCEP